jgi:hypothetical protein
MCVPLNACHAGQGLQGTAPGNAGRVGRKSPRINAQGRVQKLEVQKHEWTTRSLQNTLWHTANRLPAGRKKGQQTCRRRGAQTPPGGSSPDAHAHNPLGQASTPRRAPPALTHSLTYTAGAAPSCPLIPAHIRGLLLLQLGPFPTGAPTRWPPASRSGRRRSRGGRAAGDGAGGGGGAGGGARRGPLGLMGGPGGDGRLKGRLKGG